MPEYLNDPSVLTKEKLKSELLAHNVELPSGNPTKDVYVQLYLKNLTAQNHRHVTASTLDAFSSDDELPPPVVSSRSRSSGRATRKTDKVWPDELDVTVMTDQSLKDELLKHGVDVGPIVASTRKLYEKKLQKLLDDGPAQPPLPLPVLTETQVNHNGNSESDLYSDKEDEVTAVPEPVAEPEPEPEPEPAPVVERPLRSRGKTPVTTRTRSSQHHTSKSLPEEQSPRPAAMPSRPPSSLAHLATVDLVTFSPMCNISPIKRRETLWSGSQAGGVSAAGVEKIEASEQTKVEENDILKELLPIDINSPTGITATCRRPIRGAAGRPVKPSGLWNDENSLSLQKSPRPPPPPPTQRAAQSTESPACPLPLLDLLPRPLSTAPPTDHTKAAHRSMSVWIKLFLLAIVAAFLFLVYQTMETNTINPFGAQDTEVKASDSTA